jgi:hypothetical protein
MMKYFIVLFLQLSMLAACNKGACQEEEKILGTGDYIADSNPNSPFFRQVVLDFSYSWLARVDLCKSATATCLQTKSMKVSNVSSKDMDLTLSLAGQGDFTFAIKKGDTIQIVPLPNYCLNKTWGTVKEIKYK